MNVKSDTSERTEALRVGAIAGAVAFVVQVMLVGRSPFGSYEPPRFSASQVQAVARPASTEGPGAQLYLQKCGVCHQPNGLGIPGAFPPLAGSSWVTADAETPIRVVLKGLSGPIDVGAQHFDAAMPELGLSDAEVALVVSHVRGAWQNGASVVTEADVAVIRAALQDRTTPWTSSELVALRGQTWP